MIVRSKVVRILAPALMGALLFGQVVPPQSLMIAVIAGEGQTNNIRQRTAREPIVEVRDQNNRPVAGASVLFLLPNSGPGGAFANGAKSLTVTTDANGRAVGRGFQPNTVAGAFQLQITATFQGLTATSVISQTNVLAAAAAAAAGGAAAGAAGAGGTTAGAGAGTVAGISTKAAVIAGVVVSGVAIGTVAAVNNNGDDDDNVSPSR